MSSLDVILSVSSQLDIYIAEVQDGGTLSVNAFFEFWHARCPSEVARLVKNLICAPALQAYWEPTFLSVDCSILDDEALCSGLSR